MLQVKKVGRPFRKGRLQMVLYSFLLLPACAVLLLSDDPAEPWENYPSVNFQIDTGVYFKLKENLLKKVALEEERVETALNAAREQGETVLKESEKFNYSREKAQSLKTALKDKASFSSYAVAKAEEEKISSLTRALQASWEPIPAAAPEPVVVAEPETTPFENRCPGVPVILDASFLNGHSGAANWFEGTIGLRSQMTPSKTEAVLLHECAHLYQYGFYGGDINKLMDEMNLIYGGTEFAGLEANADCIALLWGASWTHYNQSCDGERKEAAEKVAAWAFPNG